MVSKKRGLFWVVLGLFLVILSTTFSSADQGGCYVYPQGSADLYCAGGTLDTDVQEDCAQYSDCALGQYFIPGSDCSEISECAEVKCNVDCEKKPLGLCQEEGGVAVAEDSIWCNPGCCKIGKANFCQSQILRYDCEKAAKNKLGLGINLDQELVFIPGMNYSSCKDFCSIPIEPATVGGYLKTEAGKEVSEAAIQLEGTQFQASSGTEGEYSLSGMNPGTYLLKINASGYLAKTYTFSVNSGESIELNFTLVPVTGVAVYFGSVADLSKNLLSQVTVAWSGPVTGKTFTDAQGGYKITALPFGDYVFTFSKIGFKAKTFSLSLTQDSMSQIVQLEAALVQGVKGITYLDTNDNQELDSEDPPVYNVKLYLDGVFRGYSLYPDGHFELEIPLAEETETHTLSAAYLNYEVEAQDLTIESGKIISKNLLLTTYLGECAQPGTEKYVEEFYLSPVPGKKQVQLEWKKPCPEVIGYELRKDDVLVKTFSPAATSWIDTEVEWGKTYAYSLVAVYDLGRISPQPNQQSITLGDTACEEKFSLESGGGETFCRTGEEDYRKKIFACDGQNQLLVYKDCAEQDAAGTDYYCAKVGEGVAECKNAGICALTADPFGLYSTRTACYGTNNPLLSGNFCYYDSTSTIVDQCQSCVQIKNCFDYRSKDACEINNCLGTGCRWVKGAANQAQVIDYGLLTLPLLVTPETGAGYCVEDKYAHFDHCSECHPASNLFENYYCTAEVCSGLGSCFSAWGLSSCESCGEFPTPTANCYAYNTEPECTGGQKAELSMGGGITASQDRCHWGRCLWQGPAQGYSSTGCVKDGDADGADDCAGFTNLGEISACRMDLSAPRTRIIPEGIGVISYASPNLTFQGDDSFHSAQNQKSALGELSYCLTSSDPNAPSACASGDFTKVNYLGAMTQEQVTVNLIGSSYLQGKKINGETYRLKFYSTDKYHNQEDSRETFVYVDNVPPAFDVKEEINTEKDTTQLKVHLDSIEEQMSCIFNLTPVNPKGDSLIKTAGREEKNKAAQFTGLKSVISTLVVSCKDDQGNVNTETKTYVFDLEQEINLLYPKPKSVVAQNEIAFKVHTVVGASCSLYNSITNEKVADFKMLDEEGKEHQTDPVPGFMEKAYPGDYKVRCKELMTEKIIEDYFDFSVDFTPPSVTIILQEGSRTEEITKDAWEEYFVKSVLVSLKCEEEGFSCSKTYYCLGAGCELITSPNYLEYTAPFTLNKTAFICYYSTDLASNPIYSPTCGNLVVEGYGITLEKPERYYFLNGNTEEVWGISNSPAFIWQFSTKVPTVECRFDFVPGFDYENMPAYKVRTPTPEGKYLWENFPSSIFTNYPDAGGVKTIYVQCKNQEDQIGPEQKMNLEYDPTAPQILSAKADPEKVVEGVTTKLLVDTNDKTLCRFSDNSVNQGSSEYSLMEFFFPGEQEKILKLNHETLFNLQFLGPSKNYSLNTQCKNGAGNLSEVKVVKFSVDYSELGYILEDSLSPAGAIPFTNVTLGLSTSKSAFCEYKNNETYLQMAGTGATIHAQPVAGLTEGEHQYPIKCVLGDHLAEAKIIFTVDLTPPVISEVNDGNKSCGSPIQKVMVYTLNESSISKYYYEVYDLGDSGFSITEVAVSSGKNESNKSSTGSKVVSTKSSVVGSSTSWSYPGSPKTQVFNNTVDSSLPLEVPLASLNQSHKYLVAVKAQDAAGNWGNLNESDGFVILPKTSALCSDATAPQIVVSYNDSVCEGNPVTLKCLDDTNCKVFNYGQNSASSLCKANLSYLGQQIWFKKSGWLCYYAEDSLGNNKSGQALVSFPDQDGDGVNDRCDSCPQTGANKLVDAKGCALGEAPSAKPTGDTDGDGLPDSWEKEYNSADCRLDYNNPDSNSNGISDALEDYDLDGRTSYQEFVDGTNPCLKEAAGGNKTKSPASPASPVPPAGTNYLPGILLIFGLLLLLGGSGYLVYYYVYSGPGGTSRAILRGSSVLPSPSRPVGEREAAPGLSRLNRLFQIRREHEERAKSRERESIFEAFHKEHHPESLPLTAQAPTAKKEKSLNREEKTPFSRLESLSRRAPERKAGRPAGSEEPRGRDVFSKLKEISLKKSGKK